MEVKSILVTAFAAYFFRCVKWSNPSSMGSFFFRREAVDVGKG
jgi:hypothetical protein